MKLEDFKKKYKPKKVSYLNEYKNEIIELLEANYSHQAIVVFLKKNGIKTTRQNVSKWISKMNENYEVRNEIEVVKKTTSKKNKFVSSSSSLVMSSNVANNDIEEVDLSRYEY